MISAEELGSEEVIPAKSKTVEEWLERGEKIFQKSCAKEKKG